MPDTAVLPRRVPTTEHFRRSDRRRRYLRCGVHLRQQPGHELRGAGTTQEKPRRGSPIAIPASVPTQRFWPIFGYRFEKPWTKGRRCVLAEILTTMGGGITPRTISPAYSAIAIASIARADRAPTVAGRSKACGRTPARSLWRALWILPEVTIGTPRLRRNGQVWPTTRARIVHPQTWPDLSRLQGQTDRRHRLWGHGRHRGPGN